MLRRCGKACNWLTSHRQYWISEKQRCVGVCTRALHQNLDFPDFIQPNGSNYDSQASHYYATACTLQKLASKPGSLFLAACVCITSTGALDQEREMTMVIMLTSVDLSATQYLRFHVVKTVKWMVFNSNSVLIAPLDFFFSMCVTFEQCEYEQNSVNKEEKKSRGKEKRHIQIVFNNWMFIQLPIFHNTYTIMVHYSVTKRCNFRRGRQLRPEDAAENCSDTLVLTQGIRGVQPSPCASLPGDILE